jgi:glycosyltransferase involved in cell wall biosynthesis
MQDKKKILYIITKGNFGGAQKYVYDLATNLDKEKFEAVAACGNKDGDSLPKMLTEKNIRVIEIEGLGREVRATKDFKVFKNLIKIIKEEKPDVIHLNSSKVGLLGALAVLYIRILCFITRNSSLMPRSIFTAHGWAFNEPSRSSFSKLLYYIAHYMTVLICDVTIAVSEKARKDIAYLPFVKDKIMVVYNGISNFEMLPGEEARQILLSKNLSPSGDESRKIIIFSIAELHNNKGIDIALRALSLLPRETKEKIIYSVAGDGEEKDDLKKSVSELNITETTGFLGSVPNAKKLLSGVDIFLLPSRTEAFPYALLEAGMAGLPIISTCVGGTSEVIHDMQNGVLVHPRNPKEIAEAILYLLSHPEKQKEFGEEIKKTISNFFSLEKMLGETVKLYR